MKNFLFFLTSFFSLFTFNNTALAIEITGNSFNASLYDDKRGGGPKVTIRAMDLIQISDDKMSEIDKDAIKTSMDFSFEKNWLVKTKNFYCYTRVGEHREIIWYHLNGIQKSVESVFYIQDNRKECGCYASGSITDPNGQYIQDVYMSTTVYNDDKLVKDGIIFFNPIPKGKQLYRPSKKDNSGKNNITTRDNVLIIKHLLGIIKLSPLQLLAADVDNNRYVGMSDVVLIRQVVLGEISGFPVEWVFLPSGYKFPDPNYPYTAPNYRLDEGAISNLNFTGVQKGDINFSGSTPFLKLKENNIQERSSFEEEIQAEEEYQKLLILLNEKIERESRPPREVKIYEINSFNGSGIRAYKKIK